MLRQPLRRHKGCDKQMPSQTTDWVLQTLAVLLGTALFLSWIASMALVVLLDPGRAEDRTPASLVSVARAVEGLGIRSTPFPTNSPPIQQLRTSSMDSPLLIFTCRRAEYLRRTLRAVRDRHPYNKNSTAKGVLASTLPVVGAPIIVSQDGFDQAVRTVIDDFRIDFQTMGVPFFHMFHEQDAELLGEMQGNLRGARKDPFAGYKALARHYGWALRRVFSGEAYDRNATKVGVQRLSARNDTKFLDLPAPRRVVILEEDLEVAVDFFTYMSALAPILDSDPTLFAVSAFNDNGAHGTVGDSTRVLRSDFFPGLGWMMPRRVWEDIGPEWPDQFWDDWLREPEQRKERQVLRPEVSRTYHFGSEGGASQNQFGKMLLLILLNNEPVSWWDTGVGGLLGDLSLLGNDEIYQRRYREEISRAEHTQSVKAALLAVEKSSVRLEYGSWGEFQRYAKELGIMDDEKAGVPRTSYRGVVETRPQGKGGNLLFITPPLGDKKKMDELGWARI